VLIEGVLHHIKTVLKLPAQRDVKEHCADDATDHKVDIGGEFERDLIFGVKNSTSEQENYE
jgi:hypothetical protein